MAVVKRLNNILKYGLGSAARERKQADKAQRRQARFASALWQHDTDLCHRQYESYEAYLSHQAAKLDGISHRLNETEAEDLASFKARFQGCPGLEGARSVLCLGARLGTEVRALLALGYFAVGIDLNPGADNTYVLPGDFHRLVFADDSVDAVYTNALDHVFDLPRVVAEVTRVLRPGGVFVADIIAGYEEGFTPGNFEAMHWRHTAEFAEHIAQLGGLVRESSRDLGQIRRDCWTQVVFRVPIS